ncbi:hypothetical protein SAMN05216298_0284 [Glycomyces sambucus]|uniref:Uncharacterized protein n=1 Tax=Glycomyces sambucus TaxID=380244 RepID=A0A1G9CDU8_9ACTN|nr:hypothetical protein SAMN05216298_0284 [Glycomyces sambucus]
MRNTGGSRKVRLRSEACDLDASDTNLVTHPRRDYHIRFKLPPQTVIKPFSCRQCGMPGAERHRHEEGEVFNPKASLLWKMKNLDFPLRHLDEDCVEDRCLSIDHSTFRCLEEFVHGALVVKSQPLEFRWVT